MPSESVNTTEAYRFPSRGFPPSTSSFAPAASFPVRPRTPVDPGDIDTAYLVEQGYLSQERVTELNDALSSFPDHLVKTDLTGNPQAVDLEYLAEEGLISPAGKEDFLEYVDQQAGKILDKSETFTPEDTPTHMDPTELFYTLEELYDAGLVSGEEYKDLLAQDLAERVDAMVDDLQYQIEAGVDDFLAPNVESAEPMEAEDLGPVIAENEAATVHPAPDDPPSDPYADLPSEPDPEPMTGKEVAVRGLMAGLLVGGAIAGGLVTYVKQDEVTDAAADYTADALLTARDVLEPVSDEADYMADIVGPVTGPLSDPVTDFVSFIIPDMIEDPVNDRLEEGKDRVEEEAIEKEVGRKPMRTVLNESTPLYWGPQIPIQGNITEAQYFTADQWSDPTIINDRLNISVSEERLEQLPEDDLPPLYTSIVEDEDETFAVLSFAHADKLQNNITAEEDYVTAAVSPALFTGDDTYQPHEDEQYHFALGREQVPVYILDEMPIIQERANLFNFTVDDGDKPEKIFTVPEENKNQTDQDRDTTRNETEQQGTRNETTSPDARNQTRSTNTTQQNQTRENNPFRPVKENHAQYWWAPNRRAWNHVFSAEDPYPWGFDAVRNVTVEAEEEEAHQCTYNDEERHAYGIRDNEQRGNETHVHVYVAPDRFIDKDPWSHWGWDWQQAKDLDELIVEGDTVDLRVHNNSVTETYQGVTYHYYEVIEFDEIHQPDTITPRQDTTKHSCAEFKILMGEYEDDD